MNPGYIQAHYIKTGVFTSTWKTDNLSTGSSSNNQVKLPLVNGGSYKFYVDWGDGSFDFITAWNQAETMHTYSSIGTYTIKIRGLIIGWSFNNTGDRLKILSITRWGCFRLGNTGSYFMGCENLTCNTITDVLNLKGTTTLASMFRFCKSITTIGRINEWNTSSITNMSSMFMNNGTSQTGEGIFDQNIGNWDVSNVTTFVSMFRYNLMFNNGGSDSIKNWNMSSAIDTNDMFSRATRFNQPIANWERVGSTMGNVTNMSNMFSSGNPGLGFSFNQPIGNWNVGNVTNMNNMFYRSRFNQDIGDWNVSKVANFNSMFSSSTFNNSGSDSIKNWTLKSTGTISMNGMFQGATNFNQPIGNWTTSRVIDMGGMFQGATNFNQPIGTWDTSNVTNMASMFAAASSFNQPISWNTSTVTNMSSMFNTASAFNNGLSPGATGTLVLNTGNVNTMELMFCNNSFNQNIGSFDVSKVTSFQGMFFASTNFNNGESSDINNWTLKTTGTVTMQTMFTGALTFNQPLNNWNTSAVTNMGGMFHDASAFKQYIGSWNVSNVTSFVYLTYNFMTTKNPATFPTTYLDDIYNSSTGWASRPVKPSLNISFGSANFTTAIGGPGKAILQGAPNNWNITDGGGI